MVQNEIFLSNMVKQQKYLDTVQVLQDMLMVPWK